MLLRFEGEKKKKKKRGMITVCGLSSTLCFSARDQSQALEESASALLPRPLRYKGLPLLIVALMASHSERHVNFFHTFRYKLCDTGTAASSRLSVALAREAHPCRCSVNTYTPDRHSIDCAVDFSTKPSPLLISLSEITVT